jgi:hypothetical protein
MKNLILFLIAIPMALLFTRNASAQFALFVNDNGLFSYNTDTILSSLSGAGIECDVFNARDSLRSPTAAEMQPYEIVIWYCSTDGVNNYFWNADDTDNNELMLYLETGGKLWLMGTDVLYDRYGSAPDVFVPGDFVYDYLGISDYNAQSYGDDGGLGVPQLDPGQLWSPTPPPTIYWIYPTAWWVDGCTPVGNAVSIYNMGPESYPLYGLSSAVYNHYDFQASEKELTFFFDPAIMDTYQNRVDLFWWTFNTIFMPPPGYEELPREAVKLITGKNPANDKLQCKIPESIEGTKFVISIADLSGKQIFSLANETRTEFNIDISSLNTGIYVLCVSNGKEACNQKFVISR